MDRYFTYEDFTFEDRSPTRRRFEVIDSLTSKVVGTFTGPNAESHAEAYAQLKDNGVR
jgi:hypothetical protein